jgi:hypothetical protein
MSSNRVTSFCKVHFVCKVQYVFLSWLYIVQITVQTLYRLGSMHAGHTDNLAVAK